MWFWDYIEVIMIALMFPLGLAFIVWPMRMEVLGDLVIYGGAEYLRLVLTIGGDFLTSLFEFLMKIFNAATPSLLLD